ncbi:MAG TPA: hypothetical protein VLZ05_15805 [Mycobacterium sp.]|nr:hypothetical protein [Mycobacterium sp.]HUH70185.1 hypothetical protein [Mycobacterium sp.]
MGVDEAGHDNSAGKVDDFGILAVKVITELPDAVALNEDVDAFGVRPMRRHGDHLRAA